MSFLPNKSKALWIERVCSCQSLGYGSVGSDMHTPKAIGHGWVCSVMTSCFTGFCSVCGCAPPATQTCMARSSGVSAYQSNIERQEHFKVSQDRMKEASSAVQKPKGKRNRVWQKRVAVKRSYEKSTTCGPFSRSVESTRKLPKHAMEQ